MRIRTCLAFMLAVALGESAFMIAGCVGDEPTTTSATDASTGSDGANSDGTNVDSSQSDSGTITDAGLSFDGANAYCNDLFPGSAPQLADVECSDAAAIFSPIGGTIPVGRYYLVSQTEPGPGCGAPGPRESEHDAVEIVAGDSGAQYIVNAALDGTNARRLTLVFTIDGAATLSLAQTCPPTDAGTVQFVSYSITDDGTSTVLQYDLPAAALGLYKFQTY